MALVAVAHERKGGLEAMPSAKFLIKRVLFWLKMHVPISCLPLVSKTSENSAPSFLFKRHPSRWLRRHPHISYLRLAITIGNTVNLAKRNFFSSNVKFALTRDNFFGKTLFTRGTNLRLEN